MFIFARLLLVPIISTAMVAGCVATQDFGLAINSQGVVLVSQGVVLVRTCSRISEVIEFTWMIFVTNELMSSGLGRRSFKTSSRRSHATVERFRGRC